MSGTVGAGRAARAVGRQRDSRTHVRLRGLQSRGVQAMVTAKSQKHARAPRCSAREPGGPVRSALSRDAHVAVSSCRAGSGRARGEGDGVVAPAGQPVRARDLQVRLVGQHGAHHAQPGAVAHTSAPACILGCHAPRALSDAPHAAVVQRAWPSGCSGGCQAQRRRPWRRLIRTHLRTPSLADRARALIAESPSSQAMGDARAMEYMKGRKIMEINPKHEIITGIKTLLKVRPALQPRTPPGARQPAPARISRRAAQPVSSAPSHRPSFGAASARATSVAARWLVRPRRRRTRTAPATWRSCCSRPPSSPRVSRWGPIGKRRAAGRAGGFPRAGWVPQRAEGRRSCGTAAQLRSRRVGP